MNVSNYFRSLLQVYDVFPKISENRENGFQDRSGYFPKLSVNVKKKKSKYREKNFQKHLDTF